MIYCKHRTVFLLSGMLWLMVGIFLLSLGLRFLLSSLNPLEMPTSFSVLAFFGKDKQNGAFFLITIGLLLGFLKGKYILSKTVAREVKRVSALPNPTTIKNIYSKKYYILLASMMGLGFLMRHLPISLDTRGFVDITIGAALINGARLYFRHIFNSLKLATIDKEN